MLKFHTLLKKLHEYEGSTFRFILRQRITFCRSKERDNEDVRTSWLNLCTEGIRWKFNNPGDPVAGGYWERLVQSIKRVLKRIMKDVYPRVETLRSFLIEAANIVNSRPLTHVPISSTEDHQIHSC